MAGTIHLTVLSLGVPVGIAITGDDAADAAAAISPRWQQSLTELAPVRRLRFHLTYAESEPAPTDPDRATVHRFSDLAQLLDTFSSLVTLEGIEERSHDLLLLHASGLADPATGLTVASVAASGTGKTTLSRSAAGVLAYVSDETVGVAEDGSIVRHPKPLSVKVVDAATKRQVAPVDVGLEVAAPTGLRLARIVLLDRSEEPASTGVHSLHPFDAIMAMVPEMSYLGRLDRPLQRLAGLLASTGGALRVSYSDAESVVPHLSRLALAEPSVPALIDPATAEALSRWNEARAIAAPVFPDDAEHDTVAPDPHYTALPLADVLVDEQSGQALVFTDGHVMLVNSIAAALLHLAQHPTPESVLRAAIVRLFGEPPRQADADGDLMDLTLSVLVERSLLSSRD